MQFNNLRGMCIIKWVVRHVVIYVKQQMRMECGG